MFTCGVFKETMTLNISTFCNNPVCVLTMADIHTANMPVSAFVIILCLVCTEIFCETKVVWTQKTYPYQCGRGGRVLKNESTFKS